MRSMTTYSRAARRTVAAYPDTYISCLAVCTPSTRSCCRDSNRLLPSIAPAQSFIDDDGASKFVVSGTKPDWRCSIPCARDCNRRGIDLPHSLNILLCLPMPCGALYAR